MNGTNNDDEAAAIRTLSTFEKLILSAPRQALALEQKVLDAIKVPPAGVDLSPIYRNLGNLHRADKTKPEGCNTGIAYYRKGQELGRVYEARTGLDCFDAEIIGCYLDFDRCSEAVEVFKEAVSRFKTEDHRVGPQGGGLVDRFVVYVAGELYKKKENTDTHMFEILDLVKDDIETCWDLDHQNIGYRFLAESALDKNDLRLEMAIHHKLLSVVRKQKDKSYEADLSGTIGELYTRCCKYRTAMKYFQDALAIQKALNSKESRQHAMDAYAKMGWMHLSRGAGNEQNAIEAFGIVISESNSSDILVSAFRGMGSAYYDLGKWNLAIEAFNKCVQECTKLADGEKSQAEAHVSLANTYVEKYRTLPLHVCPEERTSVLKHAENHVDKLDVLTKNGVSLGNSGNIDDLYSITKVKIVLGRRDTAIERMGELFRTELYMGCHSPFAFCHCCCQRHGESVKLLVCAGCKLKFYCNRKHQKKKWRERYIDHRTLCPFLNRWRRVKKSMKKGIPTIDSVECIKNDFADMIECKYFSKDRNNGSSDLLEID